MSSKVVVMVVDPEEPRRGQITVTDGPVEAARLAETLLESGTDQAQIRIFTALEVRMIVRQRPVVSLVGGQATVAEASQANEPAASGEDGAEDETPTPFVQNGVRFSSLFKSS